MTALPPAPAALLALCLAVAGCGRGVEPVQLIEVGAPERVLPSVALEGCGAGELPVGAHFTALAGLALPGELRVLWPGQQVTDDLRPTRLNAQVNESGTVRRVFCG